MNYDSIKKTFDVYELENKVSAQTATIISLTARITALESKIASFEYRISQNEINIRQTGTQVDLNKLKIEAIKNILNQINTSL
jgi:uncharacterized coiled-coil protein SlyX